MDQLLDEDDVTIAAQSQLSSAIDNFQDYQGIKLSSQELKFNVRTAEDVCMDSKLGSELNFCTVLNRSSLILAGISSEFEGFDFFLS